MLLSSAMEGFLGSYTMRARIEQLCFDLSAL